MILPHPESDLSINIMVLGKDIIEYLKKKKTFVLIENLLEDFLKRGKKRTPDMFLNTISFLYSFGLIEQQGYKIKLNISNNTQQLSLL
jgi:hypothetical protein